MKYLRKILKGLLWVLVGIVALVLILVVILQFPKTQNYLIDKAVHYVSGKTKSKVSIGEINISFPKAVLIKDVFLEDKQKDTLLFAHKIKADMDLFALAKKEIVLNDIVLEDITAHITRSLPDSSYNFDFIIDAFAPDTSNKKPSTAQDTSGAWNFSIENIQLKGIYATYTDAVDKSNFTVRLGIFETAFDEFDLKNKKIYIDKVLLENTISDIQLAASKENGEPPKPFDYDIQLGSIDLANIQVVYKGESELFNLKLGELMLQADDINVKDHKIDLEKLQLSHTSASLSLNKKITEDTVIKKLEEPVAEKNGKSWVITLKNLNLLDNDFRWENNNKPVKPQGIDFNHLAIGGLDMSSKNILLSEQRCTIFLNRLAFLEEKSGFRIKNFITDITYDTSSARLSNFDLQTNQSRIKMNFDFSFPSLQAISDSIGELGIAGNIEKSTISFKDILYFQPDLIHNPPFSANPDASIILNGELSGAVKDLNISQLVASTGNNTRVELKGSIKGMPHMEKTRFDMDEVINTGSADIQSFVPKKMMPANISLPSDISITGKFEGSMKNFNSNAAIRTSDGNVMAHLKMNEEPVTKKTFYTSDIDIRDFDLGKLLGQSQNMGEVSLSAKVNGEGLNLDEMNTGLTASIEKAVVKGYEYRNLSLKGTVKQKGLIAAAAIKDPNLDFTFNGNLNFDKEHPKYQFTFDLNGADLKSLHLTKDDIRVSGVIMSDLSGSDINSINGNAGIKDVLIIKNGKPFPVDSLVFASINSNRQTSLSVKSAMISGNFEGTLTLGDLPKVLKQHINTYFSLQETGIAEKKKDKEVLPQNFSFEIALNNPELFTEVLIPDLTSMEPFTIKGSYNSNEKKLSVQGDLPAVVYSGIKMDELSFNISSDDQALNYEIGAREISNASILLTNTSLRGKMQDDSLRLEVAVKGENENKLLIGGALYSVDNSYKFRFDPGRIMFNGETWNMNSDNFLQFGKNLFYAHHIQLENNGRFIAVNTPDRQGSSVQLRFGNFDLATLSKPVESDKELARGTLNGDIILKNIHKEMSFSSDLDIKGFSFQRYPLGDIYLTASNNEDPNKYLVHLNLQGNENDMDINGYYLPRDKDKALNFTVDLNNLNLSTLEPYTFGQVKRLSGSLTGDLKVQGSSDHPSIEGVLDFKKAGLQPAFINSYLRIENEQIRINSKGIYLNTFTIVDTLNNTATIDGYAHTSNFKDYTFDLDVNTDNFLVLNTKTKDNKLYHGTVFVDSDIHIGGNNTNPLINARVKLNEGTDFTFIRPENSVAKKESEGIVEFLNTSNKIHYILERKDTSTGNTSEIKGITLNSTLQINREAILKIVVDAASGDSLLIRGNANLSLGIDPGGKMSLTGEYKVAEGHYQLSFSDLVKRKFDINPGSTISWTGGPMDALVNIQAIYTAETSPIELVEEQIADMDEEQKNTFKSKLPFQVYLKMEGELLKPEISFDIQLPDEKKGAMDGTVEARLDLLREDEAELNKQVFALLVLNRFVAQDPLDNSGGSGISSTVRSSASKVLSQQLNSLSSKYIKGADVNLGVESYEDYSSGEAEGRTQLELGVSKKLLDDRLSVQVGGDIDLEGRQAQQNDLSNVAGNVSAEYSLTKDGRIRLKGFRKNEYEGVIEGELTETGIGIIFKRNYNNLKELFRRDRKESESVE